MATVDLVAQTRFWHSLRSATEDFSEGLSTGRAIAADGHWTKWTYFCARLALDPLLVAYQDPVLNLNRSGAYTTAAGRNCSSLVVSGEGVEDGDRVLIRNE